jgi:hypothetical protein
VSSALGSLSLSPRKPASKTPTASIFAVILKGALTVSKRALADVFVSSPRSSASKAVHPVFIPPSSAALSKRQNAVLAIPTTYAGLNSGPAPGALVGIVLGSIAGFILILYIILSALRLSGNWGRNTIVEEEIVRSRRRSRSRSRAMSEVNSPRRVVREREETVVVEENVSEEDDIVEVIEEHSPERPPKRGPSGRSGFRTVDPAEFGGGNRPMRKVSRR